MNVDFVNNKLARALVDTRTTHNFMIKYATKRLKFKHTPTDSRIKTVNIDPQSAHGVAISIGAKLGYWKGTTNFAIIKMDIFDMILGRSSPHNVIP